MIKGFGDIGVNGFKLTLTLFRQIQKTGLRCIQNFLNVISNSLKEIRDEVGSLLSRSMARNFLDSGCNYTYLKMSEFFYLNITNF